MAPIQKGYGNNFCLKTTEVQCCARIMQTVLLYVGQPIEAAFSPTSQNRLLAKESYLIPTFNTTEGGVVMLLTVRRGALTGGESRYQR